MDQSIGEKGSSSTKKLKCEDRYLLSILCFVNMLNYFDRFSVSTVLIEIQEQFRINNAQGGLLHSALLLAITFSAPFFGYCGDRFSRKWLILSCMLIWIVSTVAGAFSHNYWALLLSRFLVGVGQGGYTIIAPTIFADIVFGDKRTLFLSIYYLGCPLGVGVSYPVSISVSGWTGSWSYGICVGPVICLISFVLLFFTEFPSRVKMDGDRELDPIFKSSFKDDLLYLVKVRSFVFTTLAFSTCSFFVGAVMWWFPKCMAYGFRLIPNVHERDLTMSALYFGIASVVSGLLGILSGLLLSRLLRSKLPKIDTIICGVGLLFSAPMACATLTQITRSQVNTFILVFFCMLGVNLKWALMTDILLYIIHPYRRTIARGVHLFVGHAFGDCISPYIVGYISDYFKYNLSFTNGTFFIPFESEKPEDPNADHQEFHSLQQSLFWTVILLVIAGIFHIVTARYIITDREKARSSEALK